jgi:4-amino-4-deoxy-L-arabinose transferase-like glycosyltransferase
MTGWPCLLLNGLLAAAAWWVAVYGLRQQGRLTQTIAAGVLAWVWSTLGMQILGVLGLIQVGWLLAWTLLGFAAGLTCRLSRGSSPPSPLEDEEQNGWGCEGVLALAAVVWASLALGLSSLIFPVKVISDGPIYHLYFAARWWKAGRLFLVASPFGESAATYFPANGELWFTWLMTGWGGDRLARIGQAPFLLLAAFAAYGCARELGAGRKAALVATSLFATCSPLILFTFEANVDTIFIAGYLSAAYFFLRYGRERDGATALVLGGLAAGAALGTKSIGVVFVPPLLAAAVWIIARRTRSIRSTIAQTALVVASLLATSGFWFGRNWLLTGNPLYPLHLQIGDVVLLSGWYGPDAMRNSIYYIPVSDWRAMIDNIVAVLDPRLVPLWLASIAGLWAVGGRSKEGKGSGWVWAFSVAAVLNVALYWLCIPYRTQQRFMLLGLGMAVVPLAQLLDGRRWLTRAVVALLLIHLLSPQTWPIASRESDIPWDLSPKIPNGMGAMIQLVPRLRRLAASQFAAADLIATAELFVSAAAAFVIARACLKPWRGSRSSAWSGASILGALAMVGAVGYAEIAMVGSDARRLFFPVFPDFYAGWMQLDARSGPNGSRVAYAGTNIPYYLMGVGLRNDVRYVNIDGHRDWQMHDYHRQSRAQGQGLWPTSRPGWDRAGGDYEAWLANLEAERIQLLVVTRLNVGEGPHNVADSEDFPIERQWADTHPDVFEPLYGVAERDPWFRLYRIHPRKERGTEKVGL